MADLPDLDPDDISVIAYWDVGVNITKSEAIHLFESFTEYDNGIDGVLRITVTGSISSGGNIRVQARLRTDGLLIAYCLRADEPADAVGTNYVGGVHGINRGLLWRTGDTFTSSITANASLLSHALAVMEGPLTAPGKNNVIHSQVNYYDYEVPEANTWYIRYRGTGIGSTSATFTEPAAGTTIHAVVLYCHLGHNSSGSYNITANLNSGAFSHTISAGSGGTGSALHRGIKQLRGAAAVEAVLQDKTNNNNVSLSVSGHTSTRGSAAIMLMVEE